MNKIEKQVIETFHYLQEHPEISWEEVETTKYIKKVLEDYGCQVTTFADCTGVIGDYGTFHHDIPVVALRADMDALWQQVNGEFKANHSCGHDAHMTIVLGVLFMLQENPSLREQIAIRFIFQPAEEVGTGALKMIQKGIMEDVDYLFGVHLRPIQEMQMGFATPVIIHGATKEIRAEIIGEDAHAARPHLTKNAIEIGALLVTLIKEIQFYQHDLYSATMTQFHAGGKSTNIIPGSATFTLDLRAQTNELMAELEKKVNDIFEEIRNVFNLHIEIRSKIGVPAAITNEQAIVLMRNAIKSTLGETYLAPALMTKGSDDFHFYTIHQPSLKATMLGLGCDLQPGLHHPHMTFNERALMNGIRILYQTILNIYSDQNK